MTIMTSPIKDLAWAAGLFEGEGSISLKPQSIQLQLGMTDRDVVQKFTDIIGLGKLYGPYAHKNPKYKPMYCWQTSGHHNCQAVIAAFWGFFGERRKAKAEEALRFSGALELWVGKRKKCPKGHPFDEKNTRINPRNGSRRCAICSAANAKIQNIKKKEKRRWLSIARKGMI